MTDHLAPFILPDCQMPDGGDPCAGFSAIYARYEQKCQELDRAKNEILALRASLGKTVPTDTEPADREALVDVVKRLLRSWLLDDVLGSYDIDAEDARNDPEFSEAVKAQANVVIDALPPYLLAPGMVAVPVERDDDERDLFGHLIEAMREARRKTRPPSGLGGQTMTETWSREHWLELAMYGAMIAAAKEPGR